MQQIKRRKAAITTLTIKQTRVEKNVTTDNCHISHHCLQNQLLKIVVQSSSSDNSSKIYFQRTYG